MYSLTFFVALLTLTRIALATPPACLIAALGAQSNPSDLKSLCGTFEPQVAGNITEKCSGDAESSAISIFSATCLASESVTIRITSSASVTTTGTVSAKTTAGGSESTSTATSTGSSTSTSSSSSASETSKSSGSSLTSPQSAYTVAPLVFAACLIQYLL